MRGSAGEASDVRASVILPCNEEGGQCMAARSMQTGRLCIGRDAWERRSPIRVLRSRALQEGEDGRGVLCGMPGASVAKPLRTCRPRIGLRRALLWEHPASAERTMGREVAWMGLVAVAGKALRGGESRAGDIIE